MKKIIAKEVNPAHVDFSFYFDDDGLKSVGGENCAVYIPGGRHSNGFNYEEYREIQEEADNILEAYDNGNNTMKYAVEYVLNKVKSEKLINPKTLHALKEWAKHADTSDTDSIAEYITLTTGEEWKVKSFTGYSQGDYCEVVYCINHYTPEHINEIGKLWLGCGTEFSIDDCYGYFVIDELRWEEGEKLRQYLADCYGCKPDELEIHLYDGEHTVTDYKIMK